MILSCRMTAGNVADTAVFTDLLLNGTGRMRRRLEGRSVLADGGYDSDSNDKAVFDLGMHPNITGGQREEPRQAVPAQGGPGV